MEMRYGSTRKGDASLWDRIQREVLAHLQVLSFGKEEALVAGDMLAKLQGIGQPIGIEDIQIAATALVADLTVVTANEDHFARIPGLRVVNWMV
jgi:tRNA(fMet)-specific endonuclease VapC